MADFPRTRRNLSCLLLTFSLMFLFGYAVYTKKLTLTATAKHKIHPPLYPYVRARTMTPAHYRIYHNSSQDGVKNKTLDYEIVISHYNEKLDWDKPLANQSHIYHKGKDKNPPFDVYKWEKLPNVGREAHTYLYHIIHNYDNLADITVFLQGTGAAGDHRMWCFASAMEFVQRAKKHEYCNIRQRYGGWGRLRHLGKWLKELQTGKMRKAKLTMGEFYTVLFGTKPPDGIPVCLTGCISATRDNLRRFPVSFYEKAISYVNDHSNPEEAHYFERLWATIINAKKP